jgi:HlyD family secretion protein
MRLVKIQEPTVAPPSGPAQPVHHRWRPWLVGLLAAVLVAGLGTLVEYRLHARLIPPPLVFLAPVTRGPVAARLQVAGRLEPTDSRTVTQPAAGRATEVSVRVGDEVVLGQVVARFDPVAQRAELARAESRLVAAEADAFRAELLVARLQHNPPNGDEAEVEEAMALAQVRLATAAAEIEARSAAHRLAQRQLGERVVRSPMAGVVLGRMVEPGQTVGAGAPLLVIGAAPRRLRLVAEAPEPAMARVSAGQPARFTVPAFPGRVFEARVARIGSLDGPDGARHFSITLDVENERRELVVGMTTSVDIDTGRSGPVFRVPLAALSFSPTPAGPDQPAIWVGDARGGTLVRTPVEVGASDGTYAEVRAAGLGEGAMVAVAFGRPPKR